MHERLVNTVI